MIIDWLPCVISFSVERFVGFSVLGFPGFVGAAVL